MIGSGNETIIFSAKAETLKITSVDKIPFTLSDGVCQLSQCNIRPSNYVYWVGNTDKKEPFRRFAIKADRNLQLNVKPRGLQFTVVVTTNFKCTQLIGKFFRQEDCDKLTVIFENLKISLSSNGVWLQSKENFCAITPTNKKCARTPLSNRCPLTDTNTPMTPVCLKTKTPFRGKLFLSPKKLIKEESDTFKVGSVKEPSSFYKVHDSSKFPSHFKTCFKPSPHYKSFHEKRKLSLPIFTSTESIVGFTNLGNTCYMNSVLQCLLNIPNFFQDLNNEINLDIVKPQCLYKALCNLGLLKYSFESLEAQRNALEDVKSAIASAANRFSGFAQHDAHEFLCQCLDQLKDDVEKTKPTNENDDGLNTNKICPIKQNFESEIVHKITCEDCGEKVLKTENCHDFSLVIPEFDENFNPVDQSLRTLIDLYFKDEVVEYSCEVCKSTSSILSHEFKHLPRVLILHIMRYGHSESKRCDNIVLPKTLDLDYLTVSDTSSPPTFVYDKSKFKQTKKLSGVLSLSEKRKSTTVLDSEPLSKSQCFTPKNRENMQSTPLRNVDLPSSFTKIKSGSEDVLSKVPKLTTSDSRKDDIFIDKDGDDEFEWKIVDMTSVSEDEEEQLKQALELSMKEFQTCQEKAIDDFKIDDHVEETEVEMIFHTPTTNKHILKDETADGDNVYHLIGVVNHHGANTITGHYTSDSFDFKSKKWRSYNDTSVKEISEYKVQYGRSCSAYVVFYMHKACFEILK